MALNKKIVFRWVKILLLVYGVVGLLLYYFQEKILFHPEALNESYGYSFKQPSKEVDIAYDAATHFNMVQFFPTDTSIKRGVVIYFHGNRENINRYAPFVENFTKHGYEVWMPDYPSFGKSTGKLSEAILYEEALQVYAMAKASCSPDSIIIYGKSLGTGLASFIASKKKCKQLILETPFTSVRDLFNKYCFMYPLNNIIQYNFPTKDYLKKVVAPITIFHGTADGVTPYANALKLKQSMKPNDAFITINGAIHNNINSFTLYHTTLDSLLTQ